MSDPNTAPNFILPEEPVSENVTATNISIEPVDVMTGDRNRARYLYYQFKLSMRRAERIDIVVSFLMESGVKMILGDLREALNRGVQIRILTGNYLGITQPSARYLIKKGLGDKVDLRFYSDKKRSFHPKAYIFHYKDYGDIFIGSSNVSRSALTSGIEWNYRFSSRSDRANFDTFYRTFEDLFLHHSIVTDDDELRRYSKSWHKPALAKDLERYERGSAGQINDDLESRGGEQDGAEWESSGTSETGMSEKEEVRFDTLNGEEETGFRFDTQNGEGETGYQSDDLNDIEANDVFSDFFQPRGAQIEALYALADARAEGAEKALVLAATGVGKTALAAFDSKTYEHVLFVAHREEILKQAARTFQNVRHSDDYGFFYGKRKDTDKAVIFASVATLGRNDYLNYKYFAKDYFGYLVIDDYDIIGLSREAA